MKPMDDKQLIKYLKQMPPVQDHLSEDDWKERVQPETYQRQRQERKMKKMIPLLSTALLIGILVLIVPSLFQNGRSTLEQSSTSSDISMSERDRSNIMSDQAGKEETNALNDLRIKEDLGTYVLYDVSNDGLVVYAGTFDEHVQHIIPLTFVTSVSESLNDAYNQVDDLIHEFSTSSSVPYFNGVTFDLLVDDRLVIMHVPEEYSLGEGNAIPAKFEEMLSLMFTPYGIDQVIFDHPSKELVSLGDIGEVSELVLTQPTQANYKMYDDEASDQDLLVPIQQDAISFTDAIEDLKQGDEDYSIQSTIPDFVDVSVVCEEDQCTIDFNETGEGLTDQEMIIAIESILMTAKSYGYSHIQFNGLPYKSIGGYDLTEAIEVPIGVNPVHINE